MVADAPGIQSVAAAAWRATYAGLLAPATIESFITNAYASETLRSRIEADTFLVADADGEIRAYADAGPREGHLVLWAIYADPDWRTQGLGTLLLRELRQRFPALAIAADVVVGNRRGEVFYERRGFVPRETMESDLFGEAVRERRWWLGDPPAASSG
jgi:GNAT superfamily N-acetyltransferase